MVLDLPNFGLISSVPPQCASIKEILERRNCGGILIPPECAPIAEILVEGENVSTFISAAEIIRKFLPFLPSSQIRVNQGKSW
jgi:hypothetical protein